MTNGFKIIGISVRTTNENNQSAKDIGNLWNRFFSEQIIDKIPNQSSNQIIVVYTDYKSNYTGEYTTIIGVPVSNLESIPSGLIGRQFEPAKLKHFVAKGAMPEAVVNTWIQIWQNDANLNRKYSYDFEVYDENSQKGEDSEVSIYLTIKD